MKRTSLLLILSFVIGGTGILNAQGRQFGARRLVLDNSDNVTANNLYLIDLNGSLGIDNTGITSGTYPNTTALVSLLAGTKTTNLAINGGLRGILINVAQTGITDNVTGASPVGLNINSNATSGLFSTGIAVTATGGSILSVGIDETSTGTNSLGFRTNGAETGLQVNNIATTGPSEGIAIFRGVVGTQNNGLHITNFNTGTITNGINIESGAAGGTIGTGLLIQSTSGGTLTTGINVVGAATSISADGLITTAGNLAVTGTSTLGNGGAPIQLFNGFTYALPAATIPANSSITVPLFFAGAVIPDAVFAGVDNQILGLGSITYSAWVSGGNTVTIRFTNTDGVAHAYPVNSLVKIALVKF